MNPISLFFKATGKPFLAVNKIFNKKVGGQRYPTNFIDNPLLITERPDKKWVCGRARKNSICPRKNSICPEYLRHDGTWGEWDFYDSKIQKQFLFDTKEHLESVLDEIENKPEQKSDFGSEQLARPVGTTTPNPWDVPGSTGVAPS